MLRLTLAADAVAIEPVSAIKFLASGRPVPGAGINAMTGDPWPAQEPRLPHIVLIL